MSKEKRELQKKNREKAIRKAKMKKVLSIAISAIVVLGIVGGIATLIVYNNFILTRAESDFSVGLNDDGTITDVKATDYVTLCDYKNMTVSEEELYPTEEEIQSHIDSLLSEYQDINPERVAVKNGDKINLDYEGSVDGVPFEGGSTDGAGTELVIGSGSYIEGFEDQLVGKYIGDSFDINVTFPEDYGNTELAGKPAVFAITLNGIYETPEFDDEFVAKNLSDKALTKDAYLKQYKESVYQENLEKYISDFVNNNTPINSYPEKYVKNVMGTIKYNDERMYDLYKNSYGYTGTFAEYTGSSSKEYEASLRTQAESRIEDYLRIQAIYEDAGLEVSSDDINEALSALGVDPTYYKQQEEIYGRGYIYQAAMAYTVNNYLESIITITK